MTAPVATRAATLMVIALILIWGSSFLFVKIALGEANPMIIAAWRVWLAALLVVPLCVARGDGLPRSARAWGFATVVGGFTLTLPFFLLAWAQQTVPSGVAGIYMAVIPLLILPLAHFFSPGETMTTRKVIGFMIGFSGVLALFGLDTLGALGSANGLAQLACFAAAFSYAVGSITIRRAPPSNPLTIAAGALLIGSIFAIPLWVLDQSTTQFSLATWGALGALGFVSTGIGMIMRVMVIRSAGSVFLSTAGYFVPAVALGVGAIFADETIAPSDAVACALILAGVWIAQRPQRTVRATS